MPARARWAWVSLGWLNPDFTLRGLRSVLDAQPLALEDRLRELRDRFDIGLRLGILRILGLQSLPRRIERPIEMLMVGLVGIEQQPDLGLDENHPLDLVQQRRVREKGTATALPLALPFFLDDERGDQQRDELGERLAQRFDPFL